MARRTDKRVRLIEAAKTLIHKQGFNLTTLADIAELADVPLGNVYYYFKTKQDIGLTVIELLNKELQERLAEFDTDENPKARLNALLNYELDQAETTAQIGSSIGGLCQELARENGELADSAAKLLRTLIDWSETQFKELNFGDKSHEQALRYISEIQGACLLANAFNKAELAEDLIQKISLWTGQDMKVTNKTAVIA